MASFKLNSKIEDIINRVNKQIQSTPEGHVIEGAIGAMNNIGQGLIGFAKNKLFTNTIPNNVPQSKQVAPHPVASMADGYLMNNDGTLTPGPDIIKLNILRKNILDQIPFTPQAQKYIQGLDVYSGTDLPNTILGVTTVEHVPMSPARVDYRDIGINPRVFDQQAPRGMAAEVLTHELVHALDRNINEGNDTTTNPIPSNSNNSQGFYKTLQTNNQGLTPEIQDFLTSYQAPIGPQGDYTRDTEGYAQTGALLGNRTLNTPVANFYDQIFAPVDRPINYSPIFPTNDFLSRLGQQDQNNLLH